MSRETIASSEDACDRLDAETREGGSLTDAIRRLIDGSNREHTDPFVFS